MIHPIFLICILVPFAISEDKDEIRKKIPFQTPRDCSSNRYFDPTKLKCVACSNGTIPATDRLGCECPAGFFPEKWVEGITKVCAACSGRAESNKSTIPGCVGDCSAEEGQKCPRCATPECYCESKNHPCVSGQPTAHVEWSDGSTVNSDYIVQNRARAKELCARDVTRECHHLANMCVLQNFVRFKETTCDDLKEAGAKMSFPELTKRWIEFDNPDGIDKEYNFIAGAKESRIELFASVFSLNGTFLGLESVSDSTILQLCPVERETKRGAFLMGRRYRESCELRMDEIRERYPETLFFELWLRFRKTDGQQYLLLIPILNENIRNDGEFANRKGQGETKWVLARRLFLVDSATKNDSLRVASAVELSIRFHEVQDDRILPPFVRVRYETLDEPNQAVKVEFSTQYWVEGGRYEKNLEIAMSVLCSVSVFWAAIRAYSWGRRSGKALVDVSCIVKLVLYAAEILSDVFLLVISIMAIWIVFAYKKQQHITFIMPTNSQEFSFVAYLIAALSLKTVALLHRNIHIALTETFFIDWERSRLVAEVSDASTQISRDLKVPTRYTVPPVIWRTYMVANEWNELQQYRKTSTAFQLFAVLFVLQFLHFEEWAVVHPGFSLEVQPEQFVSSRFSRFAVNFLVFLVIGFVQWTFNVLIFERIVTDPFHNFIDLCSVANVSVLALTHPLYGYYIHGRSVHGRADTGMLEMNEFLQREANNLVGQRGLESGAELQTFSVSLPRTFRESYDKILAAHRQAPTETRLTGIDKTTVQMVEQVKSHAEMNEFLVDMLSHTNAEVDFVVTDAKFIENVLDLELGDTTKVGNFVRDPSEVAFSRAFVHGNEWVHLSFELILFCLADLIFDSRVLAAFATFVASSLVAGIISVFFTNNLVKSSLVDHRFLF